ncbi:MAG TPA: PAS domain S-box protein [Bacteroidales bacterium]|nr:PAS domain S-box protein [Bacteroidales bacterium]
MHIIKDIACFYDHLFINSNDAIFILTKNRFVECNPAALRLFDCDKEDIIDKSILDISPEKQASGSSEVLIEEYFEAAIKNNIKEFEWVFTPGKGKIIARIRIIAFSENGENFFQIIVRDISGKDLQRTITESKFLNQIQHIFPGLFFIYEVTEGFENAKIDRYNRKWYCDKLGYKSEDVPGGYPDFIFSSSDNARTSRLIELLKSNGSADIEIDVRHKEGYDIPYLFVTNLFETGNKKFFTGIGIDISERKYAENALKQSEEYFKNIFNSSNDGIMILDLDLRLLNANNVMFRMIEYKFEDIVFQNILDFLPEQSRPLLLKRNSLLRNGQEAPPLELEIKTRTGACVPVEINSMLIKYGQRTGILSLVRDLTERKNLEKKIFNSEIQSEEKERERFAKELHDGLGPILSTCKIYLHSLNEMLEGNEEIIKISDRALNLLDQALASIKEISNNLSPHVLRNFGLVQAVIAFTHNIEFVTDLKFQIHYNNEERISEVIEFTAYRIIIELINNTIKYAEASLIIIDIFIDKTVLKVSYSDNGKGFDISAVKKSKKGFGLTNIETRISKFNGSYRYKTALGKGTQVNFTLQLNQSER